MKKCVVHFFQAPPTFDDALSVPDLADLLSLQGGDLEVYVVSKKAKNYNKNEIKNHCLVARLHVAANIYFPATHISYIMTELPLETH